MNRRCSSVVTAIIRSRSGSSRSMRPTAFRNGPASNSASSTASKSSSLVGNTRKIVPSAMPAASATSFVVVRRPCSISSGRVAVMIAARRSSGDSGLARSLFVSIAVKVK